MRKLLLYAGLFFVSCGVVVSLAALGGMADLRRWDPTSFWATDSDIRWHLMGPLINGRFTVVPYEAERDLPSAEDLIRLAIEREVVVGAPVRTVVTMSPPVRQAPYDPRIAALETRLTVFGNELWSMDEQGYKDVAVRLVGYEIVPTRPRIALSIGISLAGVGAIALAATWLAGRTKKRTVGEA